MPSFAPRISPRLLDVIELLAPSREPIAELNRRVGVEAERLGLARPSYQRVRELVHVARDLRAGVSATGITLDVVTRARSPWALTELATLPPREKLRNQVAR